MVFFQSGAIFSSVPPPFIPSPLRRAVLRLTTPFSLLGAPTLALPTAAPWIGAQLVGRHGDDAWLLGLALTLEDSR